MSRLHLIVILGLGLIIEIGTSSTLEKLARQDPATRMSSTMAMRKRKRFLCVRFGRAGVSLLPLIILRIEQIFPNGSSSSLRCLCDDVALARCSFLSCTRDTPEIMACQCRNLRLFLRTAPIYVLQNRAIPPQRCNQPTTKSPKPSGESMVNMHISKVVCQV